MMIHFEKKQKSKDLVQRAQSRHASSLNSHMTCLNKQCMTSQVAVFMCERRLYLDLDNIELMCIRQRCAFKMILWKKKKLFPLSKRLSVAHVTHTSLSHETQAFIGGVTGRSITHRLSNPHFSAFCGWSAWFLKRLFQCLSSPLLLILLCW